MTPTAKRLRAAIDKADADLERYQARCKHKHVRSDFHSSDSDYYNPHRTWYECECLDCGKMWNE